MTKKQKYAFLLFTKFVASELGITNPYKVVYQMTVVSLRQLLITIHIQENWQFIRKVEL